MSQTGADAPKESASAPPPASSGPAARAGNTNNNDNDENDKSNNNNDEEAVKTDAQVLAQVLDAHSKWEQYFQKLLVYKQQKGNTLVPNRYPPEPQLGHWVTLMRRLYKNRQNGITSQSLTDERIKRLEEVGFQWTTRDPRHVPWESRYEELLDFVKRFGHSQVPIGWQENVKLSNWVSTQRQEYKLMMKGRATRLTVSRIEKLNKLNFVWEAQRGGPRRSRRAIVAVPPSACPVDEFNKKRKSAQYDATAQAAAAASSTYPVAPGFMPPGFMPGFMGGNAMGMMPMQMFAHFPQQSSPPGAATLFDTSSSIQQPNDASKDATATASGEPSAVVASTNAQGKVVPKDADGSTNANNNSAATSTDTPANSTQPNALAGFAGYMGQMAAYNPAAFMGMAVPNDPSSGQQQQQQQQQNVSGDSADATSNFMGQSPWQALPGGVFQHSGAAAAMASGMFPIASPYGFSHPFNPYGVYHQNTPPVAAAPPTMMQQQPPPEQAQPPPETSTTASKKKKKKRKKHKKRKKKAKRRRLREEEEAEAENSKKQVGESEQGGGTGNNKGSSSSSSSSSSSEDSSSSSDSDPD